MLHDYSRNSFSLPIGDPRKTVNGDKQKEWMIFKQSHSEILKLYNLIITNIISHSTGIDLVSLRERLIYEYYLNKKAVDDVLDFIRSGNAKDIQFENGYANKLIIFRSPKRELRSDSYCVFIPQVSLV